jgi:hypothetical protein
MMQKMISCQPSLLASIRSHGCHVLVTSGALILACCIPSDPSSEREIPKKFRKWECTELEDQRRTKEILITSLPSRAQIEVNGQSIGETPCVIQVTTNGHDKLLHDHTIIALPSQRDHYPKSTWLLSTKEPPVRVFFDMRLKESKTTADDSIMH